MFKQTIKNNSRSIEQIREHYLIEKELANKLRNASKDDRRYLYTALYDDFFRRVPDPPILARKDDPKVGLHNVTRWMRLLRRFLKPDTTFLEVGPGDCRLAFEVAKSVKRVYVVDVSEEITNNSRPAKNFELIISDGINIPVSDSSVDVAYSNQLMEHLHPDDAFEQLRNIYNALTVGGIYLCITPNRLAGPHDISKYFDEVASGLHLKEYTTIELVNIFKTAGFTKFFILIASRGIVLPFPLFPVRWIEGALTRLPRLLSKKLSRWFPIRLLIWNIKLVAMK